MSGVVEWVKNYSMVFLLMTVLTSVAAKKEYRKYIQLFVEIVLVITLVDPLLDVTGKSEDLFEKISYDSLWQQLEGIKKDKDKMDFLNEDYYISYYENAIEEDVALLAKDTGYIITDASVTLDENYEVKVMELTVAKEREEMIIIGNVDDEPENRELTALKEKIAEYYRIDTDRISIRD